MSALERRTRPLLEYGVAILAVGVALIVSLLTPNTFEPYPFIPFFLAATLSAWFGGFGAGLLASALSILLVNQFFLSPAQQADIARIDAGRLVFFFTVTLVLSAIHELRRRSTDVVRQNRDQLDIYLREMANGITVQDKTGKLIYANYEAARLMGFVSSDLLLNASAHDLLSNFELFDENGEPFPESSLPGRLALLGLRYPEARLRYRFKDSGRERWAYVKARPVFDEKGEVKAAISLFLDITELKDAQEALSEQREQFRVILRSIGDAVIATDAQGNVTFVNPVAEKLTHVGEHEALQQPIREIISLVQRDSRDVIENPVKQVLDGGGALRLAENVNLIPRKGEEVPIEVTAAPILDAQEHTVGAVLVLRDMTEREQIERAERDQRIFAEALRDTAEALTSTLDLGQVLDRILENVGQVVPHDAADIMLIEDDYAHVVRYRGYDEFNLKDMIFDLHLSLEGTGTLKTMIDTRQPLIVPDSRLYPGWVKLSGMEWLRAYLSVPLVTEGKIKGFLNVSSVTPGFYGIEQQQRLQAFAAQASVALRNAQLYRDARTDSQDRTGGG